MLFNINQQNDAWVIHREDIIRDSNNFYNGYFIIDAFTGSCFGGEFFVEAPIESKIICLVKKAIGQASGRPKKIFMVTSEPYIAILTKAVNKFDIKIYNLTHKEIDLYIEKFTSHYKRLTRGSINLIFSGPGDCTKNQAILDNYTKKSYNFCPCASGKKFKFCCLPVFNYMVMAIKAAMNGDLNKALDKLKKAEIKIGRTAEIVCCYAICWSFFDKEQYLNYINEAITINPNHPRANYMLGIVATLAKEYEDAVKYYTKAIDNYPKDAKEELNETYNNLGAAYYNLKDYAKAKQSWERGLVLLPLDKKTKYNLKKFIYENAALPNSIRELGPFIKKFMEYSD